MIHPHCGMRWVEVLSIIQQKQGVLYDVVVTAPPRVAHVVSPNSRVLRVDENENKMTYIISA